MALIGGGGNPGGDSIEDTREYLRNFPGEISLACAETPRPRSYLPSFDFSAGFGVSVGFGAGAAPSLGAGAGAFAGSGGRGRPL
jgi:hypothetical protein